MSPLTARSYGNDLLRWWRLLGVLEVACDHATRAEVEVLVGWLRSADNPQRRASAGSLRQRPPVLLPRAVPDGLVDELVAAMRSHRDRALLTLFLSTGARANELLGVRGDRVDWSRQQVWVVSKGTRALQPVPASPEALVHLARYFDEHGTPGPEEIIWRTLRGAPRPLSYFAARRVLQRANERLGTDWTQHDLQHTTITRMPAIRI